jgi:hypothetical protein
MGFRKNNFDDNSQQGRTFQRKQPYIKIILLQLEWCQDTQCKHFILKSIPIHFSWLSVLILSDGKSLIDTEIPNRCLDGGKLWDCEHT